MSEEEIFERWSMSYPADSSIRPVEPRKVSIEVGDRLTLANDEHEYLVTGMLFLGHPVTKLTIELEAIER